MLLAATLSAICQTGGSEPPKYTIDEMKAGTALVRSAHPDLQSYIDDMRQLARRFPIRAPRDPNASRVVHYSIWLEMLYLAAKHGTLSGTESRIRGSPRTVTPPGVSPRQQTLSGSCSPAVEDTIAGTFNGWDGESIFKLDNGQIWQQMEYSYMYSYSYRPTVTIYETSGGCRMKVEDEEETVLVRRIK